MNFAETPNTASRIIPAAIKTDLLRVPPLSRAAIRLYTLNPKAIDLRELATLISTDPPLSTLVDG